MKRVLSVHSASAINDDDLDFVIYEFMDSNVATSSNCHTAGKWSASATYSEAMKETTLTDSGAEFQDFMEGWIISLTAQDFAYVEILDVVSQPRSSRSRATCGVWRGWVTATGSSRRLRQGRLFVVC